ncbi:hypothetical protein MBH78_18850, partial [Oceanimonas sp. NS1]|nr:hypothetical protein [Oceanimonas sp. NS1]
SIEFLLNALQSIEVHPPQCALAIHDAASAATREKLLLLSIHVGVFGLLEKFFFGHGDTSCCCTFPFGKGSRISYLAPCRVMVR